MFFNLNNKEMVRKNAVKYFKGVAGCISNRTSIVTLDPFSVSSDSKLTDLTSENVF
jgi:hypothetical protein